jgi:hypothetical protein
LPLQYLFIDAIDLRINLPRPPYFFRQRCDFYYHMPVEKPFQGGEIMLCFTVSPPGHEKLRLVIHPEEGRMETNIATTAATIENPKMCNKCACSKTTRSCNLLQALMPILVYFSDFLSHEEVVVEYEEKRFQARFVDSAQRAGFILCLYAMFHSSCEYFSQFSFILKYYRINITYDIFMHFILTTALLKRQVDLDAVHDTVDIFSEVKAMADEFRTRLRYIMEDARCLEKKDAAINALNIIFSLNSLSADYLREFYREFLDNLKKLRPGA